MHAPHNIGDSETAPFRRIAHIHLSTEDQGLMTFAYMEGGKWVAALNTEIRPYLLKKLLLGPD